MDVRIEKYGFKSFVTESVSCEIGSKIECIRQSIVAGIRNYFAEAGASSAILGLSGGIDSALVAALAVEALGSDNVKGVLLPSQYSSEHSVSDAVQLALNLGIEYEIIHVESAYNAVIASLEPLFKDTKPGLAEENLQARIRGTILMTIANKFGYILLNTSNKSESAVGYGTIYGDMCGGLAVIGGIYKTTVYELSKHINSNKEIIPVNSILKPPSAELRLDQKDTDSLPDYDILDKILTEYIDNDKSISQIIDMGFDKNIVEDIVRLIKISEWKRIQAPPAFRV